MPRPKSHTLKIAPTWLPTPEAVNALPEPLRRYIHDLETNTDPAGMVRENIIMRAERDALVLKVAALNQKAGRPVALKKRRQ